MQERRLSSFELLQTKRGKTIRSYLAAGGAIQPIQIKLKFLHYTANKFDYNYTDINKWNSLSILTVMRRIYLFQTVGWNYRTKIGFPVCKKENFAGLQAGRKSEKSARTFPTPHHTSLEERSACFIAQPLCSLLLIGPASATLEICFSQSKALRLYDLKKTIEISEGVICLDRA